MFGKFGQQRINRLFLNLMRRCPVDPLVAFVLGELNFHVVDQGRQIDDQLFLGGYFPGTFVVDDIFMFKFEIRIDFYIRFANAGFFFEFAQRTLLVRFAGIDVAFGQIPSLGMSHQ